MKETHHFCLLYRDCVSKSKMISSYFPQQFRSNPVIISNVLSQVSSIQTSQLTACYKRLIWSKKMTDRLLSRLIWSHISVSVLLRTILADFKYCGCPLTFFFFSFIAFKTLIQWIGTLFLFIDKFFSFYLSS